MRELFHRVRHAPWISRAHVRVYRALAGRIGGRFLRWSFLLLETTGRRTGQRRVVPLAFIRHDGRYVVVASNAGAPGDPAWLLNLRADPQAVIQVGAHRRAVVAHEATAAEAELLWPRLDAAYGGYRRYRLRTQRELPIVVLTPTGGAAGV